MLADTLTAMALREETDGRQSRSVPFDRAADYYDATRGFPPGIEDAVADAIVATGRLQPTSRVLEIGVGTGRIALPLARRVGSVLGVDLSAPMLAKLLEKRGSLPVAPARADATQLPYADDSVDAAVAVHVFHLIPGWRTVLHELARVLRPGGRLLHGFDDPARGAAWTRWRERADRQLGVENVGVPRAQIESFLEDEGWRPVDAERIGFERRMRPSALIDLIASRTWSVTWRMTDAQLAEATDALRADLSAEFDDLDREVTLESGFWVRAYRPPVR